jgi:hypothetical protein
VASPVHRSGILSDDRRRPRNAGRRFSRKAETFSRTMSRDNARGRSFLDCQAITSSRSASISTPPTRIFSSTRAIDHGLTNIFAAHLAIQRVRREQAAHPDRQGDLLRERFLLERTPVGFVRARKRRLARRTPSRQERWQSKGFLCILVKLQQKTLDEHLSQSHCLAPRPRSRRAILKDLFAQNTPTWHKVVPFAPEAVAYATSRGSPCLT